jgi:hypothetical protein
VHIPSRGIVIALLRSDDHALVLMVRGSRAGDCVSEGGWYSSAISFSRRLSPIAIVLAFYGVLLASLRRHDARLERGLEGVSIALHRWIGALLGAVRDALAEAGSSLRSTGQHLHKRVACL